MDAVTVHDGRAATAVGRRLAAYALDLAIVVPILFVLQLIFGLLAFALGTSLGGLGAYVALLIVAAAVSVAAAHGYLAATMLRGGSAHGQTVGRQALQIRVVAVDQPRLNQLTILTRDTLPKYVLPLAGLLVLALNVPVGAALLALWLVDSLAAVADGEGRSLHDRVGGTRTTASAAVASPAPVADPGYVERPPIPPSSAAAPVDNDLARYGPRLAAALLDGLFAYLILGACFGLAIGLEQLGVPAPGLPIFVGFFLLFFYSTLLIIRRGRTNGQTFGKQLMGIRVVRDDGERITLGVAFLRELVLTEVPGLLTFGLYPIVDSLWPLWEEQRRALHDLGASTRVVRVLPDYSTSPRSRPDSTS